MRLDPERPLTRTRRRGARRARRLRLQLERTLNARPTIVVLAPGMAESAPAPEGVVRTLRSFYSPAARRGDLARQAEFWLAQRPAANDDRESPAVVAALAALPRRPA